MLAQTFTKPKKQKHKKKKIKLALLRYYRVEGDKVRSVPLTSHPSFPFPRTLVTLAPWPPQVTRLRKECPSETCGAGVFMANHFDRYYCGKCGLTFVADESKKA